MKMSKEHFRQLYDAISAVLPPRGLRNPETYQLRARWDALWRSGFDVERLYKAGLNDDHIDTALRKIMR